MSHDGRIALTKDGLWRQIRPTKCPSHWFFDRF